MKALVYERAHSLEDFAIKLAEISEPMRALRVPLQLVYNATLTASRCASRTRSSPPTSAVSETDFGAEKVASQPARCSTGDTIFPSSFRYLWTMRCRTNCSPGLWVLAFGQTGKLLRSNRTGKLESFG